MSSIKVTYEDLAAQAKSLRDGQADAEAILTKLQGQISALVQDGFVTEKASGAFDATYQQFTKGATQTIDALNDLASFLDKSVQALTSTDEQLASAIK